MHRPAAPVIEFEGFALDIERRALHSGGDLIELRPKSLQVLVHLARNAGRVISKDEFFSSIWPDVIVTDESLTRCISDIRLALNDSEHRCIKTVPRQGYVFVAETVPRDTRAANPHPTGPLAEKPSIAVVPFEIVGPVTGLDYVADGFSEDINAELSRFSDLLVIASNSSWRYRDRRQDLRVIASDIGADYIVDGSFRYQKGRLEISARLVDGRDGSYRWAETFDREVEAIQVLSGEIVGVIAGLVGAHVMRSETEKALQKRSHSWRSHELYLKACGLIRRFYASYTDIDLLYEGRSHLKRVIEAEPRHGRAYAALGGSYFATYLHKFDGDFLNDAVLARIRALSLKAIDIDPLLAEAHEHYGHALLHAGEHAAAIAAHSRASELNPNRADWRFAIALIFAGEHERAIQVVRSCLRRDPFCSPVALGWMARAFYGLGRYSDALLPLEESVARAAGWRGAPLLLAATYARLGNLDKARAAAVEALRREPGWTIQGTGRRLNNYLRPDDAEHFFEGLRLAGLPESS